MTPALHEDLFKQLVLLQDDDPIIGESAASIDAFELALDKLRDAGLREILVRPVLPFIIAKQEISA